MNTRFLKFDLRIQDGEITTWVHIFHYSYRRGTPRQIREDGEAGKCFTAHMTAWDDYYLCLTARDEAAWAEKFDANVVPLLEALNENSFGYKEWDDTISRVSSTKHVGALWDRNHRVGALVSYLSRVVFHQFTEWETVSSGKIEMDSEGRFVIKRD